MSNLWIFLLKLPSFNRDSVNLYDQWKLFSEQCKFLLINNGPFSKHSEPPHIAALLNWLGWKSYQVFNNLNFYAEGKDKYKIDDVLFMFEKHFTHTICTPIVVTTLLYIFKPM